MKIISVVGARPQFIKLFPLSMNLRDRGHKEIIVHTGQHYDFNLSDRIFEELSIPKPEYNLGVGSNEFGTQVGLIIVHLERVLKELSPELVLNYGDTNTTLATAIVSARLGIKQAHIESGLRCGIRTMPEEQNRIAADHLADLLFAPTPTSLRNLFTERVSGKIFFVGDIMTESLKLVIPFARKKSIILEKLGLSPKEYSVLTIHRAENTENPQTFINIFQAIREIGDKVVFPVHPRSRKKIKEWNLTNSVPRNLILIEPVGYMDMLILQENASIIITDSGGMQKEALVLGTPCITLRDVTEWVETIEIGANMLVGTEKASIINGYYKMKARSSFQIPYCFNINTSELIADIIENT